MRWLLRKLGFMQVDYFYTQGRHVLEIDGKVFFQGTDAATYLPDGYVVQMTKALFSDCEWF